MATQKTICSDWFDLEDFPAQLDREGFMAAVDVREAIDQLVCAGYLEATYFGSSQPRYRMVIPPDRSTQRCH